MDSLLTQQFKEHNITVYGTHDKPLFKAKDHQDLLTILWIVWYSVHTHID